MDLDKAFVQAYVNSTKEARRVVLSRSVTSEYLIGEGRQIFEYVQEHYRDYTEMPSPAVLEAKLGFVLDEPAGSLEFFVDEIVNRRLYLDLKVGVQRAAKSLEESNPREALREIGETHTKAYRDRLMPVLSQPIGIALDAAWKYYLRIKAGERGVQTPWASMNALTLGFWPEDFVLVVAKSSVGKCLDKDTLIVDPVTGVPRTIEQICNDDETSRVTTWSKEKGVHVAPITAKVDTGTKECLKVTLATGREVIVTPEHPFLTPDGWKRADGLIEFCEVALPARMPEPEQPICMSESEIEVVATRSTSLCGGAEYLAIPDSVFRLSNEQLVLFLGVWLKLAWAPRCRAGGRFVVHSYEKILRQVQSLLLRLGVQSYLKKAQKKYMVGKYRLEIAMRDGLNLIDAKNQTVEFRQRFGRRADDFPAIYWDKIVAIAKVGNRKIYDLTVAPTSCFVANDIIVHNTWFLIILAVCAYLAGKRVLFATTEISQMTIGLRTLGYYNKLSYSHFRKGELTIFEEEKVLKSIGDLKASNGFSLVGGGFDFKPETLDVAIQETGPDLVLMDGAYLVKSGGNNRFDQAANTFDELKRIASRNKVPLVASTQFNREVRGNTKKSEVTMDSVAMTSVASWNADLAFALIQTEEMKMDKRMTLKPLKVREGFGPSFDVEWDLDNMSFREIVEDTVTDADAFGVGAPTSASDPTASPTEAGGAPAPPGDNFPF